MRDELHDTRNCICSKRKDCSTRSDLKSVTMAAAGPGVVAMKFRWFSRSEYVTYQQVWCHGDAETASALWDKMFTFASTEKPECVRAHPDLSGVMVMQLLLAVP